MSGRPVGRKISALELPLEFPANPVRPLALALLSEGATRSCDGVRRTDRLAAPAVGASLVAFVLVYFAVFGMGAWYLLRLMAHAPQPHEPDLPNAPAHAAGITPAPALAAGGRAEVPHG